MVVVVILHAYFPEKNNSNSKGSMVKIREFFGLNVCYSPSYLVSKMGSLFPQLKTVAEI